MRKRLLTLVAAFTAGILSANAQTGENYYMEDFESLSIGGVTSPEGWTISQAGYSKGFTLSQGQGVDGSKAFQAQMTSAANEYWFYTQAMNVGESPMAEFQYKTSGVIGDAPANCMSLYLSVSTDGGNSFTTVDSIPASEFASSTTYALWRVTLPEQFADQECNIKLQAVPAVSGTMNLYVDNFAMGTQAEAVENDLAMQGTLSGPTMPSINTECTYSATVFNNGTAAQSTYTVSLMGKDDAVLATVEGKEIAAGATETYNFAYTPQTAGKQSLYAAVNLEGDQNTENDRTPELSIEVLEAEEGTVVEVGNGTNLDGSQPFSCDAPGNISLAIYTSAEMAYMQGDINKIVYDAKILAPMTLQGVRCFVGETDVDALNPQLGNDMFIDPATLTEVFNGNVILTEGDHQAIEIPFSEAYAYSGRNFVVYMYSVISNEDDRVEYGRNQFYTTSYTGSVLAATGTGSAVDCMDPNTLEFTSPKTRKPNLKVFFSNLSQETYDLTFNVKDNMGNAISDAIVTLNDSAYAAGQYVFTDLSVGLYTYSVAKNGFSSANGTVALTSKDDTVSVTLTDVSGIDRLSGYIHEDFENISYRKQPLGWDGDFFVDTAYGQNMGTGSLHRLTHNFWQFDGARTITTNPILMGSDPEFSFAYRVMLCDEVRGTYIEQPATGESMEWQIHVSTDLGQTWQRLHAAPAESHVATADYQTFTLDVSEYANQVCQFRIYVNRLNQGEAFYFDIDNLSIGTRPESDMAVVSNIQGLRVIGAGDSSQYTVQARNLGRTEANYTMTLYADGSEVSRSTGTLQPWAYEDRRFSVAFDETGDHVLKAEITFEGDEESVNNAAWEMPVSVQAEGTKTYMVDDYEGERIASVPMSLYYPHTFCAVLYTADRLDFEAGEAITGIALRSSSDMSVERMRVTVRVGETNVSNLYSTQRIQNLIDYASLTIAYDGAVNVAESVNGNLVIPFQTPYAYNGGNLIVVYEVENTTLASTDQIAGFYSFYTLSYGNNVWFSAGEASDVNNYLAAESSMGLSYFHPSTTFMTRSDISFNTVTFNVIDQNNNPVSNATLTFNGTELPQGQYVVENVADGTYPYSASLNGETVSGQVSVNGADVTETVQFQHVANEFNTNNTMIRVYPNPTTSKLYIDIPEGAKEVGLYNIAGRLVHKVRRVSAGVTEMDMSSYRSGIYLLLVDGKAFKVTKQ